MIQRLALSVALVAVTPVLLVLVVLSTIYLLSVLLSHPRYLVCEDRRGRESSRIRAIGDGLK